MGRLLTVHPCVICNYFIEDELHQGGSGISPLFLRNHYALGSCHHCHNLMSVLVPNTDQQTYDALNDARNAVTQMEADAVIGDMRARDLLPLFREALDTFEEAMPGEMGVCTVCGSVDFEVFDDLDGTLFDEQDAWVRCPRCEEGQLLVETVGHWD